MVGSPQPIEEGDQQRLVQLSDPQKAANHLSGQDCDASALEENRHHTNLSPSQLSGSRGPDDQSCLGPMAGEGYSASKCSQQAPSRQASLSTSLRAIADYPRAGNPAVDTPLNSFNEPLNTLGSAAKEPLTQLAQLQHQALQQERLRHVERRLRSSLNLSAIFGAAVVETAALFGAEQVTLLRHEPDAQSWVPVARYCHNQTLAWQSPVAIAQAEFPTLIGSLCSLGALLLSSETRQSSDDPQLPPDWQAEIRQWLALWPGNWLLVPVFHQSPDSFGLNAEIAGHSANYPRKRSLAQGAAETPWGLLAMCLPAGSDPSHSLWSPWAIAAAQSIALELGMAMHQARQYQDLLQANQELQKLALSDGLTCLANRRRFDEHLSDEWQRLARDKQPLSLILCDLDHFKRYNDAFGHPAGDRCLIRVARALLNGPQRPADLVARYGGEEFAIILPNTDTHGAWRIAKKIHDNVRDLKIAHAPANEEPYVTVTMGVSTVIPGHDTTAQMLVQASDLALYHAKQQGRNRTYVHAHYNTVNVVPHSPTAVPQSEAGAQALTDESEPTALCEPLSSAHPAPEPNSET